MTSPPNYPTLSALVRESDETVATLVSTIKTLCEYYDDGAPDAHPQNKFANYVLTLLPNLDRVSDACDISDDIELAEKINHLIWGEGA